MAHKKTLNPSSRYLIHLLACGLHGRPAQALPKGASWEQVHALARWNSVEGAAWAGAHSQADAMPADLARTWAAAANLTMWRRLQFDTEREHVLAALDDAGFSYLPLKGVLIAPLYPDASMRAMADNDILYGYVEPDPDGGFRVRGDTPEERDRTVKQGTRDVARVMEGLGYVAEDLGRYHHDGFQKAPIFNFELHRALIPASEAAGDSPLLAGPFENPWKLALPDEPGGHAFHFTEEIHYLFIVAHAYKHFHGGGTGIRNAVDEYVVWNAWHDRIDLGVIAPYLDEMGVRDFELRLRDVSLEAFGERACNVALPALSADADGMLAYMLGSGTYGTLENHVANDLESRFGEDGEPAWRVKLGYLAQRISMPEETRRDLYPVLGTHKALAPLFYLARIGKLVSKLPKVARETGYITRYRRDGDR